MGPDLSLAAAVATQALHARDGVGLVDDGGASLTFAELDRAAAGVATTLAEAGVAPGDSIAWAGRNDPGLVLTMLAAQRLGAVFVPLSFRATPPEVAAVVEVCGARVVVGLEAATPQLAQLPTSVARLVWGPGLVSETRTAHRPAAPDDLALLLHSSGTSGRPKAVMLSHANLWWSARNLEAVLGLDRTDVTLAVAPLFHVGGLNCFTMATLARGGTVLLRETFDPVRTLADLTSHVTTVFGVPAMYEAVARLPEFASADLSGVRAAVVGGAAVRPQLLEAYRDHGLALLPSWGMTEAAPSGTLLPAGWVARKPYSVGLPLPYLRVELHDPDTDSLVTVSASPGEMWVSGPQVTAGYWRDSAATEDALRHGWLRTGDLATWDDDGCLRLVGRLCEIVNSGGEKICPGEVETALAPLVERYDCELVVVGIPDPTWGEVLGAVLQPGPTAPPSLDEVRDVGGASLARFKLPKHLVIAEQLPRTASGKVDRRAVRTLAAGRLAGQSRPDGGVIAGAVRHG